MQARTRVCSRRRRIKASALLVSAGLVEAVTLTPAAREFLSLLADTADTLPHVDLRADDDAMGRIYSRLVSARPLLAEILDDAVPAEPDGLVDPSRALSALISHGAYAKLAIVYGFGAQVEEDPFSIHDAIHDLRDARAIADLAPGHLDFNLRAAAARALTPLRDIPLRRAIRASALARTYAREALIKVTMALVAGVERQSRGTPIGRLVRLGLLAELDTFTDALWEGVP